MPGEPPARVRVGGPGLGPLRLGTAKLFVCDCMVRKVLLGALKWVPGLPAQARDQGVAPAGPSRAVTEEVASGGRGAGGQGGDVDAGGWHARMAEAEAAGGRQVEQPAVGAARVL